MYGKFQTCIFKCSEICTRNAVCSKTLRTRIISAEIARASHVRVRISASQQQLPRSLTSIKVLRFQLRTTLALNTDLLFVFENDLKLFRIKEVSYSYTVHAYSLCRNGQHSKFIKETNEEMFEFPLHRGIVYTRFFE